jgi:hypothetical protein
MKRRSIILPLFQVKTTDASGVARLQICSCCYSILQQEQNLSRQELQFSQCLLHEAAAFAVSSAAENVPPVGTNGASSHEFGVDPVSSGNFEDGIEDDIYLWDNAASNTSAPTSSPTRGGAMRLSASVVQQASKIASGSTGPDDHRLSPVHSKVTTRLRAATAAPQA